MKKKPDLFLEESILDDFSKSFNALEMPLSRRAFNFVIFFVFIVGTIIFARIFILNVNYGDFYKNRALANMSDITFIPSERGLFFDRFGKTIVGNVSSFRAVLKISNFFKKNDEDKKNEIGQIAEILSLQPDQINEWIKNIDLEKQNLVVLSRDLSIEQVAKLKNLSLDDIDIEQDFSRQYDNSGVFSHILGYVGAASVDDLKSDDNLFINDLVGKAGLELSYDKELRGKNGEIVDYKNAKNESFDQKISVPRTKGDNLYLTIDSELQTYFFNRLKNQLAGLGRVGGAGIIMDPQTGEILSLVSLPSFDNNKISSKMLVDPNKPLFNRAVSGLYSPGSTIKPLVAVAALKEQVIDPLKQIFSPGYLDIPNPYNPGKSSRFLDWRPQGWIDAYSAIARSSDVYFYIVGGGFPSQFSHNGIWNGGDDISGLGIEKLRAYWQKFGLDQKTGIDISGEKTGFLPDVEEKEKRSGTPWRLGDTYNVSIGQGDLVITPVELINYISSLAAGGKTYRPFFVKKIESENGGIVSQTFPKVIIDNSNLADFIKEAEKGMIDASKKSYGTAYLLNDLPFTVASKTGSAQIENNAKENAFYVGYGPLEKFNTLSKIDSNQYEPVPKQIAVMVLIENSLQGSLNAVPVARDVFQWYYENRLKTQISTN